MCLRGVTWLHSQLCRAEILISSQTHCHCTTRSLSFGFPSPSTLILVLNSVLGKSHWPFDISLSAKRSPWIFWTPETKCIHLKGKERSPKIRIKPDQPLLKSQKVLILPLIFCVCRLGPHPPVVVVQALSRVQLSATPWTAAWQASLSFTVSRSLLKLMSTLLICRITCRPVFLRHLHASKLPARRSNQSILKEVSPGCSLVGLILKLKLPILWPPDAKSWLIWKDPDAGKDWGQEEKGTTEDEMFGWHHRLDGHRFGWTPGVGDGQWGLVCCGSWGHKESDTTERLNSWTELKLPGGLLKTKIAGSGTEPEILYLTNSQVMLMLLGQGPNFENHWLLLWDLVSSLILFKKW